MPYDPDTMTPADYIGSVAGAYIAAARRPLVAGELDEIILDVAGEVSIGVDHGNIGDLRAAVVAESDRLARGGAR